MEPSNHLSIPYIIRVACSQHPNRSKNEGDNINHLSNYTNYSVREKRQWLITQGPDSLPSRAI
ncbi:hypothetical protein PPNK14_04310 [Pectobacterium parmentieri]